ncbi:MAG: hypothetical protein ORN49_06775 [Rhodobacteraceae bacterium]|nr:hypothetical protein [Paracoccaceae bacterium]
MALAFWKMRRELLRIYFQAERVLMANLVEPVRQSVYDRAWPKQISLHEGARPLGNRVALYILYQPNGLLRSTLFTLDHLAQQGFDSVVVTNSPLSQEDRTAVGARAALIVERRNIGYDFCAYRDGLRVLKERGVTPERLILMNDSTWFPLREADDTLARMEAAGADMIGHVFKTESLQNRGLDHVESHLLMFSRRAITHPAFAGFWDGYRMSDNRVTTIARGEKRLTQSFLAGGLKAEGLLSADKILKTLDALDDAELLDVMGQIVHHREDARAYCASLRQRAVASLPWRADFLSWTERELSNSLQHLLSVTFIEPAMRLGGMGFVKKANEKRHHLARVKVLESVDKGRLPPLQKDVETEMRNMVSHWVTPIENWRKPG